MKRLIYQKIRKMAALTGVLTLGIGLSACGASSSSYAVMETTAASYDRSASSFYGGVSGYGNDAASYEMEAYSEENADSDSSIIEQVPENASYNSDVSTMSKKLIRTVNLSFETREFEDFTEEIEAKTAELGGYVESSNIYGNTEYQPERNAYYTLRIPEDRLDEFLKFTEGSAKLTSKYENTQDVTLNYYDTELRKKSLQTEQERLLELLAQAESVDAIIAVQSRLSEIQYQLDSYESTLRSYDNQVRYSTVSIDITEKDIISAGERAGILERIRQGFMENLRKLGIDIVNIAVYLITELPQILTMILFFGVIYALIKKIFGKRKDKKNNKNAENKREKSKVEDSSEDAEK